MPRAVSRRTAALADDRLDRIFRALGDRTRRALLARLAREPATVTDAARDHAMTLPAISQHLDVLEHAGLIRREPEGRRRWCVLDPGPLQDLDAWLHDYRAFWTGTLDHLAQYLSRTPPRRTAPRRR